MGVIHTQDGPRYTGADASQRIREQLIAGTSPLAPERSRKDQLRRAVRVIVAAGAAWPVARLEVRR